MGPESGATGTGAAGAESEHIHSSEHAHKGCWCCEVNDAMNRFARDFGPSDEVRSHFRNSRVEFLKGLRRIIDERIDRLSRQEQRGTKVNVE